MSRLINQAKELLFSQNDGQFAMILDAMRRRLYSGKTQFGLRRDLTQSFNTPQANIPLVVRPFENGDISTLLDVKAQDITLWENYLRMHRLEFLKADIPTCYVAATSDNSACYMQWLIGPSENDKIQAYFKGRFPLLAPDEALLEYAFTPDAYRRQRIMSCAMAQIAEKAKDLGARWVITFVDRDNIPALKGCKIAGFVPYLMRTDKWRLFRRHSTFKQLPPGTPYPFDLEQPTNEKHRGDSSKVRPANRPA